MNLTGCAGVFPAKIIEYRTIPKFIRFSKFRLQAPTCRISIIQKNRLIAIYLGLLRTLEMPIQEKRQAAKNKKKNPTFAIPMVD